MEAEYYDTSLPFERVIIYTPVCILQQFAFRTVPLLCKGTTHDSALATHDQFLCALKTFIIGLDSYRTYLLENTDNSEVMAVISALDDGFLLCNHVYELLHLTEILYSHINSDIHIKRYGYMHTSIKRSSNVCLTNNCLYFDVIAFLFEQTFTSLVDWEEHVDNSSTAIYSNQDNMSTCILSITRLVVSGLLQKVYILI